MFTQLDKKAIDTLRMLSIDAIDKANSGHPGLPLGAAPMAYVLWSKFLKINPASSTKWTDRDRFVLSAGHGSALLYSLLHLSGYNVKIEDLKGFRQWNSVTPGHPEVNYTDGVEATTGPLGQGIAMSVGMAMSEAHLGAVYNRDRYNVVDHYTYVLCGDGDLMEGISHEACSLAGHLKLGKLVVMYDSNDISLDGPTDKSFTEDIEKRFEAYGWQYILVKDGNDLNAIHAALEDAKLETNKPTIIEVKTIIGYGASSQGTSKVHGAPLGSIETEKVKQFYGLDPKKLFNVPNDVREHFKKQIYSKGGEAEKRWNTLFEEFSKEFPNEAKQYEKAFSNKLPEDWDDNLPSYTVGYNAASRVTSKEVIYSMAKSIPGLWGGSADLSSSNNTMMIEEEDFSSQNYAGRNIWFGVREFAMSAILNGIYLHGGTKAYGGTFFVFVDYLRAAVRLSALQKLPVIYVLTHDSVAVGEDGPTHEPIEQLASLRCMPNVNIIRPADGNETVAAWKTAVQSKETPTILVLSRQNLPVLENTDKLAQEGVNKGAYIISEYKDERHDGILIATGSEVKLAIKAQSKLHEQGKNVSVVSMPSFELFSQQNDEYKQKVLPSEINKRISIEMGSSFGWDRFIGTEGKMISIDRFGASAPGDHIISHLGFTVDNIVSTFNTL